MGDEKSFLDLTMADLKTAKDFVDKPDPAPLDGTPAPAPAAKSTVGIGFVGGDGVSVGANDTIIDIPAQNRAELDDLAQRIGGVERVPEIFQRYDEANTIFDLDGELDDRPFASAAERNKAALQLVAMVDKILANPALAAQELEDFFARDPNDPVMRAYWAGDHDTVEMVTKLSQAAAGEPVVGRSRSKGDGFIR